MSYFICALIAAAIGVIPLVVGRKFVAAGVAFFIGFLLMWGIFYLFAFGLMAPYLGGMVFFGAVFFAICAGINVIVNDESRPAPFIPPGIYALLVIFTVMAGLPACHSQQYANMLGSTETKVWTRDVQPKDEKHVRLMSNPTALYLAHKSLGVLGTVGSQFEVADDYLTLQRVNNELVYVVPLDFIGFSQWTATKESPGYIVIDAQNPDALPTVVKLPPGAGMKYMPQAGFDENLFRYLRHKGYVNSGFAEANFELDENHHPYWIVPLYQRQILWGAAKITSVLIVDPVSGDVKEYAPDQVPVWVDRVIPKDLIQNYLNWHGKYAQGIFNKAWNRSNITKAEEPQLVYMTNNTADWATGMTTDRGSSDSDKDKAHDTLLSIAYTNSRTGHTVFYTVDGGATDTAIVEAVDANQDVSYKKLHGAAPQIYNLYGDMVAVVPLFNSSGAYQGVAFVSVKNPQEVAVGQDVFEAGRNYQAELYRRNGQALPSNSTALATIQGVVDRIRQDVGSTGSPYYLHLTGVPMIFTAFSRDYPKLPITMSGDRVTIQYIKSGEQTVPVRRFDNLTLPLNQTPAQASAEQKISTQQDAADATTQGRDIRKHLDQMSDAELAKTFDNK